MLNREEIQMFEEPRNLLVVYKNKDEVTLNHLKKFVDTKDDDTENEKIIGTEDGSVKVISWDEKTWLDNKKAGNNGHLDDKILFLGDIKGVDKLIPTLDIKFNQFGVAYGFSGKQAAIIVSPDPIRKKEKYNEFIEDLKKVCDSPTARATKSFDPSNKKAFNLEVATTAIFALTNPVSLASYLITDAFLDAKLVKQQQLLYGVANLYLNDLDKFMKS